MRLLSLIVAPLALLTVVVGVGGARPSRAQPSGAPRFPLVFHVASGADAEPVTSRSTLDSRVAQAAELFAPANVDFHIHDVVPLPAEHRVLETIRERRVLRRYLRPRVINVFVVGAILDPNPSATTARAAAAQGRQPTGRLSGAHIPSGGRRRPGTYIVLAASGSLWSLPHELGHFYGAPHHRDPDNVMSYGFQRRTFNERQLRTFRRTGRRLVRRRELRPMLPPRR